MQDCYSIHPGPGRVWLQDYCYVDGRNVWMSYTIVSEVYKRNNGWSLGTRL